MTEQLTLSLSFHIVLGIINNLEMRICLDFMQILCYFIYGTWASADLVSEGVLEPITCKY